MNDQPGKLLVVESDDTLRGPLVAVLRDSDYEVSTDCRGGMKAVLAFIPDLVILGADSPQLDCCDLLSEIKGSKHTHAIRVLMVIPGSSAERTRGLDLGADDVLSLPLDPPEFLARIRSQLRSKQVADELWERLCLTEEHENTNQQVVEAVNEERRTFLGGAIVIVLVLIIVGLVSFSFYRRSHAENTRSLCRNHAPANRRALPTRPDGTLAPESRKPTAQPHCNERSTRVSTDEPRPIPNYKQPTGRHRRSRKSGSVSRRPPSEARKRGASCSYDYRRL